MRTTLIESTRLAEAATTSDARSGRMSIQVITPGWGSSGYYSPTVCESAAGLIPAGTHMYLDHPSESARTDRPERSVRDIAAITTEAARWDADAQAVVAECQVLAPYRELLTDETFASAIGLSITGSATDVTEGEAEGHRGPIIEGLAAINSVDFVTRAGRGGKVLEVLESARPSVVTERAISHGVAEATADERRTQLSDAVRTAYAGPNTYAWVQDFDDTTVWFQASGENERSRTWEQAYTVADDDMSVALTGERTEVRPVTKYVPVNPAGRNTTEASKEDTMGNIQIEEAEHRSLLEKAGRVDELLAENGTLKAENSDLKEAAAQRDRTDRARQVITERAKEAGVSFTALEERGLLADLPVKEGALDEEAFTKTVDEAAAEVAEANGAGRVRGFGSTTIPAGDGDQQVTEADIDTAVGSAFGRTIKEA